MSLPEPTANEVALILEDLGVVNIVSLQNPRTGKTVKSMVLVESPPQNELQTRGNLKTGDLENSYRTTR